MDQPGRVRRDSAHLGLVRRVAALASLSLFVLLVERVGMLQVTRVLAFAGDEGRKVIERMYRAPFRERRGPGTTAAERSEASPAALPVVQTLAHHGAPGVIQAVDTEALIALAARAGGVVVMTVAVGDTVMDGMPILRVHGTGQAPPLDRLLDTVELGPERTFEQDPKYAIRILWTSRSRRSRRDQRSDNCRAGARPDRRSAAEAGPCDLDVGRMRDAAGHLRLDMPVPSSDDLVGLALDEIRFCGATSVQVMRRIRALLQDLRAQVLPERLAALECFLLRVDNGIRRDFADADDQRDALELDRQGLGMAREQPGAASTKT